MRGNCALHRLSAATEWPVCSVCVRTVRRLCAVCPVRTVCGVCVSAACSIPRTKPKPLAAVAPARPPTRNRPALVSGRRRIISARQARPTASSSSRPHAARNSQQSTGKWRPTAHSRPARSAERETQTGDSKCRPLGKTASSGPLCLPFLPSKELPANWTLPLGDWPLEFTFNASVGGAFCRRSSSLARPLECCALVKQETRAINPPLKWAAKNNNNPSRPPRRFPPAPSWPAFCQAGQLSAKLASKTRPSLGAKVAAKCALRGSMSLHAAGQQARPIESSARRRLGGTATIELCPIERPSSRSAN